MAKENKFVCISGMPGAGKSVVSDYFAKKGYYFVRFGQITLDVVKRRGLKPTEKNERKIREGLRKRHGMVAFAKLNYPKFKRFLNKGDVIADGLYSWAEYKFLKERFGENMFLIAVYAPPDLRYERISSRVMPKDDKDLRHRPFTKREAKSRDFAEIEKLDKGGPIAMADYTILNTKGVDYFVRQIKEIYGEIKKK
jgi:dephospho-CoA kinase